jgi:hypothetical protein
MTTNDAATRQRAREVLRAAGLQTEDALDDLVELCARRGLTQGATDVEVHAIVNRIRVDCPGAFEPRSPSEAGALGYEEFRRRYPDAPANETAADEARRARRERDLAQVRVALAGTVAPGTRRVA